MVTGFTITGTPGNDSALLLCEVKGPHTLKQRTLGRCQCWSCGGKSSCFDRWRIGWVELGATNGFEAVELGPMEGFGFKV